MGKLPLSVNRVTMYLGMYPHKIIFPFLYFVVMGFKDFSLL